MNENEIRNMEAGRDMDALVARRVFKADSWCPDCEDEFDMICTCERGPSGTWHQKDPLPDFSTNIAAAWEVVEKMAELIGPISVAWGNFGTAGNMASVMALVGIPPGVVAPTAPLAICRAALLAAMEQGE